VDKNIILICFLIGGLLLSATNAQAQNAQAQADERVLVSNLIEFSTDLSSVLSEEDNLALASEYHGALIETTPIQLNVDAFKYIPLKDGRVYTVKADTLSGQSFYLPLPDRDEVLTLLMESAQKLLPDSVMTKTQDLFFQLRTIISMDR